MQVYKTFSSTSISVEMGLVVRVYFSKQASEANSNSWLIFGT